MITDDKRREVAQNLREQAENSYFTLMQWWDHLQFTVMGKVYITAPEKVYLAIADLIDRPTTTRHGKFKTKYGRQTPCCEVCGYSIGDMRWNYCPKCGAVITDD